MSHRKRLDGTLQDLEDKQKSKKDVVRISLSHDILLHAFKIVENFFGDHDATVFFLFFYFLIH